jgi:hypothetical protein
VHLQLHLTSLHTWVVSREPWILQIMGWSIITWETSTTVHTVLRTTGPHVSHTCPSRHLKVQNYEDTCEVACAAQKGNKFARQPSLPRLLQDTVNAHSVRPLRRQRSSCCSKHHTVLWRSPSRHFVCRSPPRNTRYPAVNTWLPAPVHLPICTQTLRFGKKNKQFQYSKFILFHFGPPKVRIKIGVKLSSRHSNLFQFLFHFVKMGPKTKIETRLLCWVWKSR